MRPMRCLLVTCRPGTTAYSPRRAVLAVHIAVLTPHQGVSDLRHLLGRKAVTAQQRQFLVFTAVSAQHQFQFCRGLAPPPSPRRRRNNRSGYHMTPRAPVLPFPCCPMQPMHQPHGLALLRNPAPSSNQKVGMNGLVIMIDFSCDFVTVG